MLMKRVVVISGMVFCGIAATKWSEREIAPVKDLGKLVVLTRESATTYYLDRNDKPTGFEYDLIRKFAQDHLLKIEFRVVSSIQHVLHEMRQGRAHIAAAGVSRTERRDKQYRFSQTYQKTQKQMVCRRQHHIRDEGDFAQLNLAVVAGSSYEEHLQHLKTKQGIVSWDSLNATSEEIMTMIWEGKYDCTISDSNLIAIQRQYFPELKIVYTFKQPEELAWIISSKDDLLQRQINQWLALSETQIYMAGLKKKYFGHTKQFDYYDINKFVERMTTRLPRYESLFKKAARKTGLSWELLAAASYQESQWDPNAISPTGVRGLMMLTQVTAKEVGVEDRTDPAQSIAGGARYLKKMMTRLPQSVEPSERIWFALAAYNVGYYHLRDAMKLAMYEKINPFTWSSMKRVLPKLTEQNYYRNLQYGYARGLEPVIYVDRVHSYYEVLRRRHEAILSMRSPLEDFYLSWVD